MLALLPSCAVAAASPRERRHLRKRDLAAALQLLPMVQQPLNSRKAAATAASRVAPVPLPQQAREQAHRGRRRAARRGERRALLAVRRPRCTLVIAAAVSRVLAAAAAQRRVADARAVVASDGDLGGGRARA